MIIKEDGAPVSDGLTVRRGVVKKYEGNDRVAFIPFNVKEIGGHAFENCETVEEIVVAEGLERIFREWGEEPQAHRIARAIVKAREEGARFTTTTGFAEFVERLVGRHGGHHPATRVFQALRMEVNDEMGELRRALSGALALLKSGGRFAVITFESLTDREVKRFFAAHAGREVSLQQGGSEWCGELPRVRLVARRAVTAAEDEVSTNPRSRSAKLRIAEKE